MRVLHVSMPTTEGVPVVLLSYVRDQVARGWQVTVACPDSGWLAEAARDAGATVRSWRATRSPGPSTLGEARRLGAIVADAAPDLLHLHSAKAGLTGRLVVRGRVPTVFQPHAWSFHAATGAVRRATVTWERWAVRWTSAFVLVSAAERADGEDAGVSGRTWIVPNGIDLAAFPPADESDRAAAREALGLGREPLAVCVGRLGEQKGQRDLLAAWPAVRQLVPNARLVLVGEGPDRAEFEADAVAGVTLVGNRTDVADWLAAANVVVAPSRWEGMALAPIEAMARARCVVATDVAGMAESLPPDAPTVPPRRPELLASAVAERLADPSGTDAAGRRAHEHAAAHHDAAAAAEAVVSCYRTLLPDRPA